MIALFGIAALAALIAWPLAAPAATGAVKVPFLVSPGISEDTRTGARVAQLLSERGAPIELVEMSPGQVTHVIDGQRPACGLTLLRDVPGRERFHWIARSTQDRLVIASPREETSEPPAPGAYVAAFYVKAMIDAADRLGLKVIPIYSFEQISMILHSGRTPYVLGLEAQIGEINQKQKTDLVITKNIQDVETWMACNAEVKDTEVAAIGAAWREAYREGALQRVYAQSGMEKTLPPP